MRNLAFIVRYRVKNPFRKIIKHYITYKNRSLKNNKILPYDYTDSEFTIHYHMGGKGPVLLFIHGFALDAMMNWADLMLPFSQHFTVLAPDLLWFGQSHSTKQPTLESQRIALERLLQTLEIDELYVVGQSYGGFVAVDLALKNPEKIKKLCIANSPGTTFDERTLEPLLKKYSLNKISDLFVMSGAIDLRRLLHVASAKKPYFPEFLLKQLYKLYFSKNQSEWRNMLDTLPDEKKRVDSIDPLKKMDVLLVWGEEDELFVLHEGEKFARLIKAKMAVIPNAGHAPQIDELTEFTRVIKEFLMDDYAFGKLSSNK